jgi:hypothetical protein
MAAYALYLRIQEVNAELPVETYGFGRNDQAIVQVIHPHADGMPNAAYGRKS